jgi:hypothetical protein
MPGMPQPEHPLISMVDYATMPHTAGSFVFDYSVNEALFLSEKEEETINGIARNIAREYQSDIDKFSQNIIVSQIETLLQTDRKNQRKIINHLLVHQ